MNNKLSGNVVDLCPVGALGDKSFLYRQRVWFMKSHAGVCTGCATGCSTWVDQNQDHVWRIRPRENPQVNKWWICNDGRYDYAHVHDDRRLHGPKHRDGQALADADWTGLPAQIDREFREAGHLAAVLSPFLTVEEAYLLAKYVRQIDPQALLALGPVPVVGQDERFRSGFTIAAEKCPNRRGVEEIVVRHMGRLLTFDGLLEELAAAEIGGLWISGGYKRDWIDEATAERLGRPGLVVLQDLFPSPLSSRATYVLPGAAFPERDGSYVNRDDQLQSIRWAIRPPAGVRPEGSLLWELLGLSGLYNARAVLSEVAAQIGYFHAAGGEIPAVGVNLKVNLLAPSANTPGGNVA